MKDRNAAAAASVGRMQSIRAGGLWPGETLEFLLDPPTLDFIAECMEKSGKSADEAILVLLAAARYLGLRAGEDPGAGSATEDPRRAASLGPLLARERPRLMGLCAERRVQANYHARAFPVMEALARGHGERPLAVIELGAAFGMIGRALCSPGAVMEGFGRYCAAGQKRPAAWPRVVAYRGLDLRIPDVEWVLACLPFAELRACAARFIAEVPAGPECRVEQGSALDFAASASVRSLPAGTLPVVLTSFMLYQFDPAPRAALVAAIRDHARAAGGHWINLDLAPRGDGYKFYLAEDGVEVIELESDACLEWRWI